MYAISQKMSLIIRPGQYHQHAKKLFFMVLYDSAHYLAIRLVCNNFINNGTEMLFLDQAFIKCLKYDTQTCVIIKETFLSTFNDNDNYRPTFFKEI